MKTINIALNDDEEAAFDKAQALLSGSKEKMITQKELIIELVNRFLNRKIKKNGAITEK